MTCALASSVHLYFASHNTFTLHGCIAIDQTGRTVIAREEHVGAAMRLIKRLPGGGFELVTVSNDECPPYAILSHTWTDGQEVTYNELVAGTGRHKAGYDKICFCGDRAAADGLEYFWVDTCCINKSTSDELSTAINSMFRWYQRASKCYVYLSDVSLPDEFTDAEAKAVPISWREAFRQSRWFTRGWTLQELLAPSIVEFFSKEGNRLGSRISLEQDIHNITNIPISALRGQSLAEFSIEDRMSWAASRTTSLKEDKVYCLLGIFGVFLSLIYGEGEAYATARLKEEIEKRREGRGTGSSRNLLVFSSLPFPRNEFFVGRTDELRSLEQYLLTSNTHRRMTIYGLGGCGKSALAIEFAYRTLAMHARLVFWVPAISQESFELAYREIGARLHVPGINDGNADVKKLVREALDSEHAGQWLMIVDNADDHEVLLGTMNGDSKSAQLSDYLPLSDRGAILFTTRSRKAAGALTPSSVLGLYDMAKAEARQLLALRLTKQTLLLDDETASNELLEALAYLPLAIVQAAAFMNNNDVSVTSYMSLFRETSAEPELFNQHFYDPSRYKGLDSTIARTWHISFDQIRKQDPLAAEYLSFMACIDRVNIPQSLLPPGPSVVQQTKALGTLTGYAFITERLRATQELETDRFFDMHRLVHMASVCWLDKRNERAAWFQNAVKRLEEVVPYGGHEYKEIWITYLSHATHVAKMHSTTGEAASAALLERVGRCQTSLGQYSTAETTLRQVLSTRREMLEPEHPDILTSMNDVAESLYYQGKYVESELMHRPTLELRKKVLGADHTGTLISMNNVALALSGQGRYIEAEKMLRETLKLRPMVTGEEHLDTLANLSNMAQALDGQGKHAEAEEVNRNTLKLCKKLLGNEHPFTLVSMNNMAHTFRIQGNYVRAEEMHRETVQLNKRLLGDKHPDTLTCMSQVARTLSDQGKYAEAEKIHSETLELRKEVLGDRHPRTLMSMNNVALALGSLGRYVESEVMHRETLELSKEVLGDEHPDTLTSMNNVALALDGQGKYSEAQEMHCKTLELCKKVLGNKHPYTLKSVSNMASTLDDQAMYDEAEKLHTETLELRTSLFGNMHPDTLASKSGLARALMGQGRYIEAEKMHREVLELRKSVLGDKHPGTLTSMSHVAQALGHQGTYVEAEKMHSETLKLRKDVLGDKHPNTLASMRNLADVLAKQHRYDDSGKLYEQACAAYNTVLGEDHPTTRTCQQNYRQILALQEQNRGSLHSERLEISVDTHTSARSRMARGLARVGIRTSKSYPYNLGEPQV